MQYNGKKNTSLLNMLCIICASFHSPPRPPRPLAVLPNTRRPYYSTMSGLSETEQAQINLSVGAVVVSNYLSYLTMGIVLSATWTYFSKFPNDKLWFKALVILCVSMCIGDTVATGMWTYDWAVANYANPAALAFTHWTLAAEPFLFGSCGLTVQLFYAWRVWIMSIRKNWILPAVIGCLSISGWCIICWIVHTIATHNLISEFTLFQSLGYIWLGASIGADVLITSSMIYYLDLRFRIELQQNRVGYYTPRRFRQLIIRTVECNLLSLFAQTIAIGLFNRSSIGFYFGKSDPPTSLKLLDLLASHYKYDAHQSLYILSTCFFELSSV
ncbi:hypothetical protein BT96DRAFT_76927 [Gymnopus androsaceus JB14]|uniref:Uncharacterized protein n=1 Tax=Gymnopus androsaceus JB14 TaxID=1447944 RepID=A0A6A4HJP0_9AGAR|nr:hypothetical protein BT96DRAFT_76927 [Gymnopus androsaceus JB14]